MILRVLNARITNPRGLGWVVCFLLLFGAGVGGRGFVIRAKKLQRRHCVRAKISNPCREATEKALICNPCPVIKIAVFPVLVN